MSSSHRYELRDEVRLFEASDPEEFDRVAFAISAIRSLHPKRLTVAVYESHGKLKIDSVRDLRGGEGARWAMVGIPPRASRGQIAHALAELVGLSGVPYAVDIVVNADQSS